MAIEAEIAWAAGLFEGEGCFTASHKQKGNVQLVSRINMTDLDVLETFHKVIGIGRLIAFHTPDLRHKSTKKMWTWYTSSPVDFAQTYIILSPWLHARRRARAEELMIEWIEYQFSISERWRRNDLGIQKVAAALDLRHC